MNLKAKYKNTKHYLNALYDNVRYGFPSRSLKVIGITGTDGKTTTTMLFYHVLKTLGKKVSVLSTVYAKIGEEVFDTGLHVTTPHSSLVQKLLKQSADHEDEYFVLEVTSHALDQHRVLGINYEVGIITNVTHEHLDYHPSYSHYLETKAKLLLRSKISFINADDKSYAPLKTILELHEKKYKTYGLKEGADYTTDIAKKINQKLAHFNSYNYLAVLSACTELGLPENEVLEAMKTYQLPVGRMEKIYEKDFTVIIDFAHTPNAIEEALSTVKVQFKAPEGRVIHVFGAAGLRDHSKRPMMGQMSGKYADITIITEEDYRTEDPQKISESIAEGLIKENFIYVTPDKMNAFKEKAYTILIEREKAVAKALEIARKGDVVIFTGKGHEKSLCRGTVEHPWSDQEAVRRILRDKI